MTKDSESNRHHLLDSPMLLDFAVVTHKQYLGIFSPITLATHGPTVTHYGTNI